MGSKFRPCLKLELIPFTKFAMLRALILAVAVSVATAQTSTPVEILAPAELPLANATTGYTIKVPSSPFWFARHRRSSIVLYLSVLPPIGELDMQQHRLAERLLELTIASQLDPCNCA